MKNVINLRIIFLIVISSLSVIFVIGMLIDRPISLNPDRIDNLVQEKIELPILDNNQISPTISLSNNEQNREILETSPSATPTKQIVLPALVDCIGPDKKIIKLSKKACEEFNNAWSTPTPTLAPTSIPGSSVCTTSTDLGNLIIKIEPAGGQLLIGDAAVYLSNGVGDCAAYDSRLPHLKVIGQGSTSVTYSGFRPGKYRVKINYHFNTYEYDVNLNSGDNYITTTVSN